MDGGLSPSTIRGHVRAIKRFFNWLVDEGYIETEWNPMLGVKLPRLSKQSPKGINLEDIRKLIDATASESIADLWDRAVILFLADTGCRVGGLVSLKVGDLYLKRCLAIVHEKGAKSRAVPFTDRTGEALRGWLDIRPGTEADYVFRSITSQEPLTDSGVRQLLRRRGTKAGVTGRINPHSFRHGFAR